MLRDAQMFNAVDSAKDVAISVASLFNKSRVELQKPSVDGGALRLALALFFTWLCWIAVCRMSSVIPTVGRRCYSPFCFWDWRARRCDYLSAGLPLIAAASGIRFTSITRR